MGNEQAMIDQIIKTKQPESPPERGGDFYHPKENRDPSAAPEKTPMESGGMVDRWRSTKERTPLPSSPSAPKDAVGGVSFYDQKRGEVEKILEEDLADIYSGLNPVTQQEFKTKGEETVSLIMKVLAKPKIKIGKIIDLIRSWLQIVPGINRFFLEQTAKIKADKIMDKVKNK